MPIQFTCPHCGNTTQAADQYAGQSGPCAQCGKTITIPPSGATPFNYSPPPRSPRSSSSSVIVILAVVVVVVLMCGGVLAALLLPAVQAAREAARRAQCNNNMKQIGLAMHNYNDKYGHFPPAYTVDKNGKRLHSWRVLILPFMEQQALYSQFKLDEPWNSPHNLAVAKQMPPEFLCPSDPNPTGNTTSYAMLVGPNAISNGPKGRAMSEITDGLSKTMMVVEMTGSNISWTEPRDIDAETVNFDLTANSMPEPGNINEIGSAHPGVVNALYVDGSVRPLQKESDPDHIKALSTINGGEQMKPEDDF